MLRLDAILFSLFSLLKVKVWVFVGFWIFFRLCFFLVCMGTNRGKTLVVLGVLDDEIWYVSSWFQYQMLIGRHHWVYYLELIYWSRATGTGRGAATKRGWISRPGSGEATTVPAEGRVSNGESELRREGGVGEGGGSGPLDVVQLRAFIVDDQSGTTRGGCRTTNARGRQAVGLTCGRQHTTHALCVVNAARRGGALTPLLCGASGCTVRHGRGEALEAVIQRYV